MYILQISKAISFNWGIGYSMDIIHGYSRAVSIMTSSVWYPLFAAVQLGTNCGMENSSSKRCLSSHIPSWKGQSGNETETARILELGNEA